MQVQMRLIQRITSNLQKMVQIPPGVSPKTLPNKKITTTNHLGDEFHHHNVLDKFKQFKSETRERVGLDFT
jgi:hypothetical protein